MHPAPAYSKRTRTTRYRSPPHPSPLPPGHAENAAPKQDGRSATRLGNVPMYSGQVRDRAGETLRRESNVKLWGDDKTSHARAWAALRRDEQPVASAAQERSEPHHGMARPRHLPILPTFPACPAPETSPAFRRKEPGV